MTIYHDKAIQLKYEGYTYAEISKMLGGKISVNTLEHLFMRDGVLYIPYQEYRAKMEKWSEDKAREDLKREASYGGQILKEILAQAMAVGNLELALATVKTILGLAGIVEEKRLKVIEEKHYDSTDELIQELKANGIDPLTGLTERASQLLAQGKIKN